MTVEAGVTGSKRGAETTASSKGGADGTVGVWIGEARGGCGRLGLGGLGGGGGLRPSIGNVLVWLGLLVGDWAFKFCALVEANKGGCGELGLLVNLSGMLMTDSKLLKILLSMVLLLVLLTGMVLRQRTSTNSRFSVNKCGWISLLCLGCFRFVFYQLNPMLECCVDLSNLVSLWIWVSLVRLCREVLQLEWCISRNSISCFGGVGKWESWGISVGSYPSILFIHFVQYWSLHSPHWIIQLAKRKDDPHCLQRIFLLTNFESASFC